MIRLLAIICLIGSIDSRLVKRSYSDQSVRGYLTEVDRHLLKLFGSFFLFFIDLHWFYDLIWTICSAFAGGTKYVKKNFSSFSAASVQFIHIVDHQDDTIMHTVRWPIRDTFGHNRQLGSGFLDPSIQIVCKRCKTIPFGSSLFPVWHHTSHRIFNNENSTTLLHNQKHAWINIEKNKWPSHNHSKREQRSGEKNRARKI